MEVLRKKLFSLEVNNQGIAKIVFNLVGSQYNVMDFESLEDLSNAILEITNNESIKALILISGKANNFIVGADISMFNKFKNPEDGYNLCLQGQRIFSAIFKLNKPVVCAINGACLGGGLEVALSCHYRIATDSPKTTFSFPEVKLGILPGATGTQRVARLIPLEKALEYLVTGKEIKITEAKEVGLIDEIVSLDRLEETALIRAEQLSNKELNLVRSTALIPIGKALETIFQEAKNKASKNHSLTRLAVEKILYVVKQGIDKGLEIGLEADAIAFSQLVISNEARSLVAMFFANSKTNK
jgi:3-hydroxyacyl-CoA dehydrogenase / enoyl-CoA hydratase / 3-hydroxybutyryl-CoA epimerase